MLKYLPLILLLGGCAAMEALGLSTPEGDPTPMAEAASDAIKSLTGVDILGLYITGKALLTKRGRDNVKNAFSPKSGLKGTAGSLAAILLGSHSPDSAKDQTDGQ